VAGDGGFQMTLQELAVLKQEHDLPVKIAIINNGFLGMVRQWQQFFYDKRYTGTPIWSPDFRQAGRGLRHSRSARHAPDEVIGRDRTGQCHARPLPDRLPGQGRGQRLSDGAARRGSRSTDPPPKPSVMQGYSGVQPSW
jgi:acetolactate synthase-1/2/3 large subunit